MNARDWLLTRGDTVMLLPRHGPDWRLVYVAVLCPGYYVWPA